MINLGTSSHLAEILLSMHILILFQLKLYVVQQNLNLIRGGTNLGLVFKAWFLKLNFTYYLIL